MKVLAFETAFARGGVALFDTATGAVYVRRIGLAGRLSREVFPAVAALLTDAGWEPAEIELVACSSGPGSFTGLRVGIAAVKGWHLATRRAVVAVPTFDVGAYTLERFQFPAVGLADARATRAFFAMYPSPGARPEPGVVPFDELAAVVKGAVTVFGPDVGFTEVALNEAGVTAPNVLEITLDPSALARLAAERFAEAGDVDPAALRPIYLTSGQV